MTPPGAPAEVVAVAGRRIDAPGSVAERFPLQNRARVRRALASALTRRRVSAVVSSAACGADLLALDVARRLGIRCRVVLPSAVDRFRMTSVVDRPGDWGPLYDALVADAASAGDLVVLEEHDGGDDAAYAKANGAILTEGEALAAALGGSRRALIVWDGASRGDGDLTQQFRIEALSRGWLVEDIDTRWPVDHEPPRH